MVISLNTDGMAKTRAKPSGETMPSTTTNSTHLHSALSRIRSWRPLAKVTAVGADRRAAGRRPGRRGHGDRAAELQWITTRDGTGSYPI
jgi:hypothetical protein